LLRHFAAAGHTPFSSPPIFFDAYAELDSYFHYSLLIADAFSRFCADIFDARRYAIIFAIFSSMMPNSR
jgi:hypothetical protein